ncbi:MAG: hypothetical protein A4E48_01607 [Methanosaeta sp. PtaU1.Bin060]|nr:MAG: hypothetical protein A4E48_01607 [Methanosaeta sp. PtaU1.Bin060]
MVHGPDPRLGSTLQQILLTITTIMKYMGRGITLILDILKGAAMQILIWRWEMHMILRYGLDWRYRDQWERL